MTLSWVTIASGADPVSHVVDSLVDPWSMQPTKYVYFMWAAAAAMVAFFTWVAHDNRPVPGRLRNFVELLLCGIDDQLVKPNLGEEGRKFLPYVWTVFFFILFNNLIGLIPGSSTPTSNLGVTGAMALTTLFMMQATAIRTHKFGYFKAIVPEVPMVIWPMMLGLEFIGFLAKTFALAVRLFANMVAGHLVLFSILLMITTPGFQDNIFVAIAAIGGGVAIFFLEIFVAFLQAFIFTFLSVIFIGELMHSH